MVGIMDDRHCLLVAVPYVGAFCDGGDSDHDELGCVHHLLQPLVFLYVGIVVPDHGAT